MHFLLSSMSAVYVLTTPIPEDGGDDATVKQIRKGPSETMMTMFAEDFLEAKYMTDDASSKKFLVSNFTNYKMTDSRLVMEQYNKLFGILGRFTQHKMNMDEAIQNELTLVELGSNLRIKESLKMQDSDKPKGNNVAGPSVVNMVEYNNSSRYNDNKGKRKHHDNTNVDPNKKSKVTCWKCEKPRHLKKNCKGEKVGNKANGSGTNSSVDDRCWFKTYESLNDGSILHMGNESTALVHGRGCVDLKFCFEKIVSLFNVLYVPNIRKNLVSSSVLNNCGYKQVIESNKFVLSKHAFMSTYKLNDSILWHARLGHIHFKRMQDMSKDGLIPAFDMDTKKFSINSITESRDAIFDENRFTSVPRPSLMISNRTEDIGGSVVPEEVTEEQIMMRWTPSWATTLGCWVDLPPGGKPLGGKWIFKRKLKVDGTIKKFKARLVIQGLKQKSGIDYFDTYAPVACISTIRLVITMESINNLIIHQMDVKTTFLNGDLVEEVYMNQP
nr:zinc finger, CCHC-type [Tanacetum cinerariifolium]